MHFVEGGHSGHRAFGDEVKERTSDGTSLAGWLAGSGYGGVG